MTTYYNLFAGTLFNGKEPYKRNVSITIKNGKIINIQEQAQLDTRKNQMISLINAQKYTVLPGLIDAHVHIMMDPNCDINSWEKSIRKKEDILLLEATKNLSTALRSGVTTIRDCGSYRNISLILKEALETNIITGPRLLVCGNPITITDGHCHYIGIHADNELEIKKAIMNLNKANVDFIKFMATGGRLTAESSLRRVQYNSKEIKTLTEEAHKRNKKVAAHATVTEGIIDCVNAGVDTIEHCSWLDSKAGYKLDEKIIGKMAESNTFVSPTLAAIARHNPDEKVLEEQIKVWRKTYTAGVKMIAGTDAGVPKVYFNELAFSIKLLTKWIGLSNLEAIKSATFYAAQAIGLENQIGTIETEKIADVIIVDGDPLEDIDALNKIIMVIKQGEIMYRDYTKI